MAKNQVQRGKHGGARPRAGRKQSPIGEVRRDFAEKLLNASHAHDRALKILLGRGNRTAFVDLYKFLCQMAFGKPVQPTHITGENGGPVQIVFAGTLPPWAPTPERRK